MRRRPCTIPGGSEVPDRFAPTATDDRGHPTRDSRWRGARLDRAGHGVRPPRLSRAQGRQAALLAACLICATPVAFAQEAARSEPVRCDVGPVSQEIAGSWWLSYACDDDRSLVVNSDQSRGNPVAFVFIFHPKADGGIGLTGEGNGDRAFTRPVFDVLKTWDAAEIAAQIQRARAVPAPGVRE